MKRTGAPTPDTYQALQCAYDHFNKELFKGRLPACLITLQRQRGAYGYFSGDRFHAKSGKATADEIAMNPQHIGQRTDAQTLSTLAHEMVHLWQHHHGKPGRRGYHNAEWAKHMHAIGLTPTRTGAPGGRETGEKVTHVIAAGGAFERACAALLKTGLTLTWHDPHGGDDAAKRKRNTRAKFTCDICGLNAWAKPGAPLVCGDCEVHMTEETAP
jgi:hypothetical protein